VSLKNIIHEIPFSYREECAGGDFLRRSYEEGFAAEDVKMNLIHVDVDFDSGKLNAKEEPERAEEPLIECEILRRFDQFDFEMLSHHPSS